MIFSILDYILFVGYVFIILFLGYFVSKEKKGHRKNIRDYFLASQSLPWWVVGASLIAVNISSEQLIGMSGSGYVVGLAVASYEWLAAVTLVIVAKFFLPILMNKGILTIPQFLEMRFNKNVRTILAILMLLIYIFIHLSSILYLGALALNTTVGIKLTYAIWGLTVFVAFYSVYGGLKAIAWTDVIQVLVIILGGLLTVGIALKSLSVDKSIFSGFMILLRRVPEKFHMITVSSLKVDYYYVPGLFVLFGGIWIVNFFYWGCNQYIIQKAFAAKSLKEAQHGLVFAGFLKILMPLVVVLPGIIAYACNADISSPDESYPWLLVNFIPKGFRGIAFAAIIASVVTTLSSIVNSSATIFSFDIYKQHLHKQTSDSNLIWIGRSVSIIILIIALIVAHNLSSIEQIFQYIKEFTGFISPGILVILIFGLFWRRTTSNAALFTIILTLPLSTGLKLLKPNIPFLNRMGIVFIILCLFIILYSIIESASADLKAIYFEKSIFHTDKIFNFMSVIIFIILVLLYTLFW